MKNLTILLNRLIDNGTQTIGRAELLQDNYKPLIKFVTMEQAWKDNQTNISCIPDGKYIVKVRYSEKYGRHLEVTNVPDRTVILFHWGNYYTDTKGCILTGETHIYINEDKNIDINKSKITFNKLMELIADTDKINLVITKSLIFQT